mmetsp:Transcript_8439/g.12471  ORF Transcript_8439/g.12471 Transcript_8439/m.12471 type:complete len:438 (+) Transcript_8439:16-1329(+)
MKRFVTNISKLSKKDYIKPSCYITQSYRVTDTYHSSKLSSQGDIVSGLNKQKIEELKQEASNKKKFKKALIFDDPTLQKMINIDKKARDLGKYGEKEQNVFENRPFANKKEDLTEEEQSIVFNFNQEQREKRRRKEQELKNVKSDNKLYVHPRLIIRSNDVYDYASTIFRNIYLKKGKKHLVDKYPKSLILDNMNDVMETNKRIFTSEELYPINSYKIGAATKTIQNRVGLDSAFITPVPESMESTTGASHAWYDNGSMVIEAELSVVLKSNIDSVLETDEDVLSVISGLTPSIEIVGSRIEDQVKRQDFWTPYTSLADFGHCQKLVFGEDTIEDPQLIRSLLTGEEPLSVSLLENDRKVARGSLKVDYPNILAVLRDRINACVDYGYPLEPGMKISTGSISTPYQVPSLIEPLTFKAEYSCFENPVQVTILDIDDE